MEKLINELCERTGIDRASAEKVASYMRDNMSRIPELLQGGKSGAAGIAGKVGEVLGKRT
jgi:hypothetical protein